ncbi:hypothetical protein CPB85DRAFT_1303170 [Mucidula mucida]|nr:hypothetical protein CPB85DRAFT_1303170 [Mucidula mucida]
MTDFCDAWRSASSHPLFDFKACKCDGADAVGFSASKACGTSAARLVGILGPILVVVVIVCWIRGIKRGLKELALFCAGLFIGVPVIFLIWLYAKFVDMLLWETASGDAVVDMALHQLHARFGPVVKRRVVCVKQEPVLPRELCDAIISACDDKATLLACSRVCMAWTHMSRRRLSVTARLTSFCRSKRVGSLLRSRSQTIAPCIHHIEFQGKYFGQHWRILRLFKLKDIHLRSATIQRRARLIRHLLYFFPDSIESLTFHVRLPSHDSSHIQAQPARELRYFLSQALQFTRLKSLTVSIDLDIVPGWNCKLRRDPSPAERPLTIERLQLCGTWSDDLALWLQNRCRKLVSLDIHTSGGWGMSSSLVETLVRCNWETLKDLDLMVPAVDGESDCSCWYAFLRVLLVPLNLSSLQCLRTLRLRVDLETATSLSVNCAIKILQMLDGKYPPSEVIIQVASQSYDRPQATSLSSHAEAFDNVAINSLGMSLGDKQSSLFRYVYNSLD